MNKKRVYTLLIILGVLVLAVLFYVSIPYIANAATRPVKSLTRKLPLYLAKARIFLMLKHTAIYIRAKSNFAF